MIRTIQHTLVVFCVLLCLMVQGCRDDLFYNQGLIDGSAVVLDVAIGFDAEMGVNLTSTRSNGAAMQDIDSFWMLVYDEEGKLMHRWHILEESRRASDCPDEVSAIDYKRSDNRLDEEGELQDASNGHLDFKLIIPTGRYHVYGVSNYKNFDLVSDDDIATPEMLKGLQCEWNQEDPESNREMFGIFTTVSNRNPADSAPIAITSSDRNLHCWVKRLASKVTIAFDGSGLNNNVQVYISSIQVRDVPKTCALGVPNVPGDGRDKGVTRSEISRYLYPNGETVMIDDIKEGDEKYLLPDNHMHVCREAHRYLGKGSEGEDYQVVIDRHSTNSLQSLFFYENLQGTGRSKHQLNEAGDNFQFPDYIEPDEEGNTLPEGWKDEKPYGTYVEVKGYYKCKTMDGRLGLGPITYRFMLGQDTEKDYNCHRNTHYKLTLCLKGYGNNADWHIVYKEETGIYADSPMFVSYLFNQRATIPVKVKGELHPDNPYLYATIASPEIYTDTPPGEESIPDSVQYLKTDPEEGSWWRPWSDPRFETFPDHKVTDEYGKPAFAQDTYGAPPGTTDKAVDGPWTGFLSLRPSNLIRLNDGINTGASYNGAKDTPELRKYFREKCEGYARYGMANGEIAMPGMEGSHGDKGSYTYTAMKDMNTTTHVWNLPLYTRPKELITVTGFTGNNPYFNFVRKTTVKFSVRFKDGHWESVLVDVIQVPRIENPKAVWRKEGSREPFHVTLMHRKTSTPTKPGEYFPMTSYGEWSAQVLGDEGIISLSTTSAGSGTNAPQAFAKRIEGAKERPVDFIINFTGKKGHAVVLVRYNGYTCEHEILCKVGYEDTRLTDEAGAPAWCNYNVFRFNGTTPVMTKSPAEEGSLFRRGTFTAILASNQFRGGSYGFPGDKVLGDTIRGLHVIKSDAPYSENSDPAPSTLNWTQCESISNNYTTWEIGGGKYRIATISDFYTLTDLPEHNERIKYLGKRYGILYADGATSTQTDPVEARQYDRTLSGRSKRGMRGVFIYNIADYRQIFLPVGALGYGRRKGKSSWDPSGDAPGTLRYASRGYYMDEGEKGTQWQPLFYDIFKRPGAIYWCRERTEDGAKKIDKSSSFDINYFTMGFEGFMNSSCGKANSTLTSDACFIRLVRVD